MNGKALIAVAALVVIIASRKKGQGAAPQAPGATNGGGPVVQPTTEEIGAVIASLASQYGRDIARNVERIYRLETAHFTSGLFGKTNAAGMRAFANTWPFGWAKRGTTADMFAPLVTMAENAGGAPVQWVAFRRFSDAAAYLAKFLKAYDNDPARWNTDRLDSPKAAQYRAAVAAITPQFA